MNINEIYDNDNSKYLLWREHRKLLADLINIKTEEIYSNKKIGKSIAIWGAGNCYDIDLNYLSNNFDKVILLDINEANILNGIHMQNVTSKNNIIIKSVDFIKNTEKIYTAFLELINKNASVKELEDFIGKLTSEVANYSNTIDELDKYDINICLGVHSQLLNGIPYILSSLKNMYDKKDTDKILDLFHKCQGEAAKKLDEIIINHSEDVIIMGLDLMELSQRMGTDKFYGEIQNHLSNGRLINVIQIAMKHSVSGAADAAEDIRDKTFNEVLKVLAINCWVWQYDYTKSYTFLTYTLRKNNC